MTKQRFHGDLDRFKVVASFIADRYGSTVRYVADVAGGQGMLARVLTKKHGYDAEVVDPRGWALRGVGTQEAAFSPEDAPYYDLIVGLHPDEATRAVAAAAKLRPVVLIPCCNFWDRSRRLGRDALVAAIADFYAADGIHYEIMELAFRGPMNLALVSIPPVTHVNELHCSANRVRYGGTRLRHNMRVHPTFGG